MSSDFSVVWSNMGSVIGSSTHGFGKVLAVGDYTSEINRLTSFECIHKTAVSWKTKIPLRVHPEPCTYEFSSSHCTSALSSRSACLIPPTMSTPSLDARCLVLRRKLLLLRLSCQLRCLVLQRNEKMVQLFHRTRFLGRRKLNCCTEEALGALLAVLQGVIPTPRPPCPSHRVEKPMLII